VKDEKAVFGLTSVQSFFAIVLALALMAYVIVAIMGTLANSSVIPAASLTGTVINESATFGPTNYFLAQRNVSGFANPVITELRNATGTVLNSGNISLTSNGILTNTSGSNAALYGTNFNVSYTYGYDSVQRVGENTILTNTSTGITNFFTAVNPVYAILAILVIILVLVVLVRVVTASSANNIGRGTAGPQL